MDEKLYDELWQTEERHWWFVARRRIVRSLVEAFAERTNRPRLQICELGCGTGGNIAAWAERHDVVGVDMAPRAIELGRGRLGERVVYGCLPDEIPCDEESFDVVLLLDVLEHLEQDQASLEKAVSLLRSGGILIATAPAYQWLYSPRDKHHHHFRRYGKKDFRQLFQEADAQLELLSHYNTLLFPLAAAARLWSKLWSKITKTDNRPGDLRVPAAPLNRLLTGVFASERHLLRALRLPFGLSLVAVARKSQTTPQRKAA